MATIFIYALLAVLVGLMIWLRTKRRGGPVKGNGVRLLLPLFIAFPLMMMSVYQLMHIPGTKRMRFPPFGSCWLPGC